MNSDDKLILCVGCCYLDVIHACSQYPEEDSDRWASNSRFQRGGNASNMCTVLRQLGAKCEFIGPLNSTKSYSFLIEDCHDRGILIDHCAYHSTPTAPFSSIILNETTGSRTIVRSKPNMPLLTANDFRKIPYERYKWIHFEGQNLVETREMVDSVLQWNAKNPDLRIIISVELEVWNEEIFPLAQTADFVFMSKDFAQFMGWMTKEVAIQNLTKYVKKDAKLICPWGIEGAIALDNETGLHFTAPARPPPKVVDSLGAGDTFMASSIYSLALDSSLENAIDFGCRIAGAKVGFYGYDNISSLILD